MMGLQISVEDSERIVEDQAKLTSKANAYKYPTELRVEITVSSVPIHNNFTRYLSFRKSYRGDRQDIPMDFTKAGSMRYTARVNAATNAARLDLLKEMTYQGNRQYWNFMYFENRGGSTSLDIEKIEVFIRYDGLGSVHPTKEVKIGEATHKTLVNGTDRLYLSCITGRLNFLNDYLASKEPGYIPKTFPQLIQPVQYMMMDLGKSGTDGEDNFSAHVPSLGRRIANPKYGSGSGGMCTETISWYYAASGYEFTDTLDSSRHYNFVETPLDAGPCHAGPVACVEQMVKIFQNSDRLYCYHLGRKKFQKVDRNRDWLLPYAENEYAGPSENLDDFSGDYIARITNGSLHSMMLISWNKDTQIAQTMDGPWPCIVREVDVDRREQNGHDYCIGKVR